MAIGAGVSAVSVAGPAWSQTHQGGGQQGQGGAGGAGTHDDGHTTDEHTDGGHSGGQKGSGGGEGAGPQAGADGTGYHGGDGSAKTDRPPWAQEGIPEIELGRLNVARSPDRVLDRAFKEALASFTPDVAAFYRLDLAGMEQQLSNNWDSIQLIDSPVQNLALMRDALDGTSILRTVGITTDNRTLLAAFLGTASDKEIPISTETALAVSAILGQPLSSAEAARLADMAERIRRAILTGHG